MCFHLSGPRQIGVDLAFAQLTAGMSEQRLRYAEVDSELTAVQGRIERLLDALAGGSIPRDEIAARLNAEKTRKDVLAAERARLGGTLKIADFDADKIKADLQAKVRDVKGVLERQTPQARQNAQKAPRRQDRARAGREWPAAGFQVPRGAHDRSPHRRRRNRRNQ